MGKVHRIKKDFARVVSLPPPTERGGIKHHTLARAVTINIGRAYDGTVYVSYYGLRYKPLLTKLIKDHKAGIAHSDKTATKR